MTEFVAGNEIALANIAVTMQIGHFAMSGVQCLSAGRALLLKLIK